MTSVFVDPTPDQIRALAAAADDPAPVSMLNLLRFAQRAVLPDGRETSGREAYLAYYAATGPHLARVGGSVVWAGSCHPAVIGPEQGEWDMAAVVRYPSRAAFLAMIGDPDYRETSRIRTAALADSRLVPCTDLG